jgi:predicted regulator of Ras-like GTPase activity (Roadblock/LC7/MglB family)
METVLRGVVTSPGVIGGIITDDAGQLLVRSMPDMYDSSQLAHIGALLMEQQFGLEDATGGVRQSEIRFELGKLVARSAGERSLVLLCEPGVNIQVLSIALNVAAKKLEKLPVQPAVMQSSAAQPSQMTPPLQSGTGWTFMPLQIENGKMLLQVQIVDRTGGTFWSSMEEHVSVNRSTCRSIWRHYSTRPSKKFSLTNPRSNINSIISLDIIEDDKENIFDGRVLITLAAAEHLQLNEGDRVMVEVPKGTGLFGWEGI